MSSKSSMLANEGFTIPSWAIQPPEGYHLDVMKGDKLLQKLLIDEKVAYFFGRNPNSCDIVVSHASCSRVHAMLVYHKVLNRPFLIDLRSSHGTFIGGMRLEPEKPELLDFDKPFHFGASTRIYVLREKPHSDDLDNSQATTDTADQTIDAEGGATVLERLTEYHTALNRRVVDIELTNVPSVNRMKPLKRVTFDLNEEIINPEDVDPNVGKFQNLVQSSLLVTKKKKRNLTDYSTSGQSLSATKATNLFAGILGAPATSFSSSTTSSVLNVVSVNIAPDIIGTQSVNLPSTSTSKSVTKVEREDLSAASKKKYPIEAWPGKYPNLHLLV